MSVDMDALVFWTVETPQYVFRVSPTAAAQLDVELTAAIVEFVRFTDLAGSACVYRREKVLGLWESTPGSRAADRAVTAALKAETPTIPGTDD